MKYQSNNEFEPLSRGGDIRLQASFAHVTAPSVIIRDTDLEYLPEEYYILLETALRGKADAEFSKMVFSIAETMH